MLRYLFLKSHLINPKLKYFKTLNYSFVTSLQQKFMLDRDNVLKFNSIAIEKQIKPNFHSIQRFSTNNNLIQKNIMIQNPAPDFTEKAVFEDGSLGTLTLSAYQGKYVVLLFYPLNFTFVCPTELIAYSRSIDKFTLRNTQVIGVSVDSVYSHVAWRSVSINNGGIGPINFPLVSDLSKNISKKYNVLTKDETVSLRGLFLIDTTGVLRHMTLNDMALGRSVDETLRMIDALQHYETHGEVCPVNWIKGKPGMKPTAEGVIEYLSSNAA